MSARHVRYQLLAVAGFVVLSRAWRGSGLDLSSPAARIVSRAVALGLALLLAGPDLVERFPVAVYGDAAGLDGRTVRIAEEVFKSLGAACTLTAGMAQRWVMTDGAER